MNKIMYTLMILIVTSVTINVFTSCTNPLIEDTEHHVYIHMDEDVKDILDKDEPTREVPVWPYGY